MSISITCKNGCRKVKKLLEVVALRKAGYEPKIYGDGAQVVEIMPESPAQGKLFSGDIITEVDGKKVNLADEVVKIVSDHAINEDVEFKVKEIIKLIRY